eukprot:3026368-Pleurochrysis_carterae.AAC.2
MFTARLCMSSVETCDEIEARSHDVPSVEGRSARQFARQNGGDVTLWESHLGLACFACLPMDQKPYGAMLRGELLYAALALAPRSLEDISPIADAASGTGATRAALRA